MIETYWNHQPVVFCAHMIDPGPKAINKNGPFLTMTCWWFSDEQRGTAERELIWYFHCMTLHSVLGSRGSRHTCTQFSSCPHDSNSTFTTTEVQRALRFRNAGQLNRQWARIRLAKHGAKSAQATTFAMVRMVAVTLNLEIFELPGHDWGSLRWIAILLDKNMVPSTQWFSTFWEWDLRWIFTKRLPSFLEGRLHTFNERFLKRLHFLEKTKV